MALPISIPYTFANATTSIPLSNLDSDFATVVSTINGIGNGTVGLTTITSPAATALTIQSSGATAVTIDTNQNVGIGTTSPSTYGKFAVQGTTAIIANASLTGSSPTYKGSIRLIDNPSSSTAADGGIEFLTSTYGSGYGWKMASIDSTGAQLTFATRQNSASWTETMRIDATGNLLVGTTTNYTTNCRTFIKGGSALGVDQTLVVANNSGTYMFVARNDGYVALPSTYSITNASAANVYIDSSGYLYRSTSSLKYKRDVEDAVHGLAEIMQLRPVTYKGNSKENGETIFGGLIAEEVHAVGLTEFVQYAEDNSPDALAYGNMVSLCVKAIQELSAKNDALEARLAALEVK